MTNNRLRSARPRKRIEWTVVRWTLPVVAVLAALAPLCFSSLAWAEGVSIGDACAAAGAMQRKDDTAGGYELVCDGANWQLSITHEKSGMIGIGTTTPTRGRLVAVAFSPGYAASFVTDNAGRGFENITPDFVFGSVGSALQFQLGAGSGNTYGLIQAYISGKNTPGNLILNESGGSVGIGDATPDHILDVAGNIGLNASSYINFGDTDGTTGYGIRDNSGTVECKNSGGSWAACAGGGSSTTLDAIAAATGDQAGIANANHSIVWNWATITTQTALKLAASGTTLTSGKILNITNAGTAFTGSMLDLDLTGSNASNTGNVVKTAITGTSSTGTPLMVTNLGAGLSMRVNDATGDTDSTPFVIDASGNVGIGTASPVNLLDISGGALGFWNPGNYEAVGLDYDASGDALRFRSNNGSSNLNQTNMTIKRVTGNVGIGTTSPSTSLSLGGSTQTTPMQMTEQMFTFNSHLDQGLIGWNYYWNGTALVRQNSSFTGVRFAANAGDSNSNSAFFVTMMNVAGTDHVVLTGNLDTTGAYGILNANGRLFVGAGDGATGVPSYMVSLDGTAARTIGMERNNTAATAGQGLTLYSGGAIAGTANLAGGDVTLKSGTSTGTGTSAMHFYTATAGSSGTSDNAPTEKMTIIGSGNVGIGTTAPGALLDIGLAGTTLGTIRLEGNTSGYVQIQPAAAAGSWTATLPTDDGTSGQQLTTDGSGVLSWAAAGSASATTLDAIAAATGDQAGADHTNHSVVWNWSTISTQTALKLAASGTTLSSGKLLNITNAGTAFTGSMLDLDLTGSNASNTGNVVKTAITGTSSTGTPLMVTNLGAGLSMRVNDATGDTDSTPFVIDASGNVGIATTDPSLSGAVDSRLTVVSATTAIAAAYSTSQLAFALNPLSVGSWTMYDRAASAGTVWTAGISQASGRVGIGVAAPGYKLHVNVGTNENLHVRPSATPTGGVWLQVTNDADNVYEPLEIASSLTNFSAGNVGIGTAAPAAKLDVVGDINYTGLITDVSDRRVKDNIRPLEAGQLEKITALQGVSFTMNGDHRTELGLIAQDVEPIYPDLVKTKPDGIRTMNYVGLIAPLIEAIKEQQREIEALRAENRAIADRLALPQFPVQERPAPPPATRYNQ